MTGYYDLSDEEHKRLESVGVDYDLIACLEHNPQIGYDLSDIERVLAVYEGQNDGESWRWIIQLKPDKSDNRELFVYLDGWCDYTGWD